MINLLINKKSTKILFVLLCTLYLTCVVKAQNEDNKQEKAKLRLNNTESKASPLSGDTYEDQKTELKQRTDVQGRLTLKTGEILEGDFRFEYRQTKDGKIPQEGNIVDGDAGKIIWYLYKDKKGKDKAKAYKAKDVSDFYISDLETYHVVTYKPDLLKTMETSGSLDANVMKAMFGGKTQKFLLHIYSTDKASLYFSNGEFILKKADDHFAIVGTRFSAKDLSKFAKNCKPIADKALENTYNGDIEQYIRFVDEYTECLSKE